MTDRAPAGRLVVVSGPAGAGKTTVLRRVFGRCRLPLVRSVSATTRPPRPEKPTASITTSSRRRSSSAAAATASLSSAIEYLKTTIGTERCEAR